MSEMRLEMDGLEKERDFYFDKLREIEILLQENEDRGLKNELSDAIFKILYATAEGFEPSTQSSQIQQVQAQSPVPAPAPASAPASAPAPASAQRPPQASPNVASSKLAKLAVRVDADEDVSSASFPIEPEPEETF